MDRVPRHVKHIRSRNENQLFCLIPNVKTNVDNKCEKIMENSKDKSKDDSEASKVHIETKNNLQETDMPMKQSDPEQFMRKKYLLVTICMTFKSHRGV